MSRLNRPNLSRKKKVQILVDKRLGIDTVYKVAAEHGTSPTHVHKLERQADPAMLAEVDAKVESLVERMEATRDLALRRIHERLEDNAAPLNHITTAFGVVYDKIALENGKPTSIIQHATPPEDHAIEFYKILLTKMSKQEALTMFRNSNLAPLVSDHTRDRIALQLESGEMVSD
jgi:hypothetical protein